MRLQLDFNEKAALMTALDNYLNGIGFENTDEDDAADEAVLEELLTRMENSGI